MAELVDALVSNTNEVTLVPVRLRLWVHLEKLLHCFEEAFFMSSDGRRRSLSRCSEADIGNSGSGYTMKAPSFSEGAFFCSIMPEEKFIPV